jgi:hypothetical protein
LISFFFAVYNQTSDFLLFEVEAVPPGIEEGLLALDAGIEVKVGAAVILLIVSTTEVGLFLICEMVEVATFFGIVVKA